jgi:hypothetical protein
LIKEILLMDFILIDFLFSVIYLIINVNLLTWINFQMNDLSCLFIECRLLHLFILFFNLTNTNLLFNFLQFLHKNIFFDRVIKFRINHLLILLYIIFSIEYQREINPHRRTDHLTGYPRDMVSKNFTNLFRNKIILDHFLEP